MTASQSEDPTEGGRWIVVDGRRWRATDPHLPERLRQELVDALMAARRSVAVAKGGDDAPTERAARSEVHQAKVALGERGDPWWEPSETGRRKRARAAVMALAGRRAPDRTICPSEVARVVDGEAWRPLMSMVRDEIRDLARRGVVEVTQRGRILDPGLPWKGPVRVRRTGGHQR